MEESFYSSTQISPQILQELIKKDNQTALIRFILMYSLFSTMGIGIVWAWNQSTLLLIGFGGITIGLLIGHCFLASYTAAEHNGLPHEGSIVEKTRSIAAPAFVKFLMWNMPYHAEHHSYPAVPFHALPQLHELMKEELIHKGQDHPGFHWMVFKETTVGR
jgi:fatty acid desaturase